MMSDVPLVSLEPPSLQWSAFEPGARFREVNVDVSEGGRTSAQPNVGIRQRSVRGAGGQSEHQVIEVGVPAGDPPAGQGQNHEIGDRILRHRQLGEDDHERVDEEDDSDRALGHVRLVLREDGQSLELRVAGGDEDDVQPEQGEDASG